MKNAILKICEKLRGFSDTEPYFEVTEVKQNENGTFTVTCKVVDPAEEQGAQNERNEQATLARSVRQSRKHNTPQRGRLL